MPKIIIWDKDNFLIAELIEKTEKQKDYYIAKFNNCKLIKSQTIKKELKRIEAGIKFTKTKEEFKNAN